MIADRWIRISVSARSNRQVLMMLQGNNVRFRSNPNSVISLVSSEIKSDTIPPLSSISMSAFPATCTLHTVSYLAIKKSIITCPFSKSSPVSEHLKNPSRACCRLWHSVRPSQPFRQNSTIDGHSGTLISLMFV